ncbi:hypothetical protein [Pseudoduganella ginsengisoli]|uniref:Uncharacterized protein n=1 Tax=Pseudoduganella ginsengisoli TaxID=1462440 RepID=A0A6L6Q864_9BURK|nr:hypothetical protein [Pseudoduganella ginsengisoli]MTW05800.1 hypothetical protein [Pseudoduganella ginsengisoli]
MMVTVAFATFPLTTEPATTEAAEVVVVVVVVVDGVVVVGVEGLSELPQDASSTTTEMVEIRDIFLESIAILPVLVAIFVRTDLLHPFICCSTRITAVQDKQSFSLFAL